MNAIDLGIETSDIKKQQYMNQSYYSIA
jgi:hypothetical protein